ncbi:hypothetical protein ACFOM8_01830 [Paracoccus angustae]|uniref:XRE family transcriptional regulator n=1 Tax=Paracoccus angustae TaxID=1671480 RepID=A0ABV7TZH2_9RHOB
MTPEVFTCWLAEMKAAGRAKTDKEAGTMLRLSSTSISQMKRKGVTGDAAYRTALACAAVLHGLEPYGGPDTKK